MKELKKIIDSCNELSKQVRQIVKPLEDYRSSYSEIFSLYSHSSDSKSLSVIDSKSLSVIESPEERRGNILSNSKDENNLNEVIDELVFINPKLDTVLKDKYKYVSSNTKFVFDEEKVSEFFTVLFNHRVISVSYEDFCVAMSNADFKGIINDSKTKVTYLKCGLHIFDKKFFGKRRSEWLQRVAKSLDIKIKDLTKNTNNIDDRYIMSLRNMFVLKKRP